MKKCWATCRLYSVHSSRYSPWLLATTKRRLKSVFPAALVSIGNVWLLSATTTVTELTVFIVLCSKGVRNASTPLLPSVSSGFPRQRKKTDGPLRQSESDFLPRWPISARKGAGRLDKNRGGARDRMTAGWLPLFSRKTCKYQRKEWGFVKIVRRMSKKVVAEALGL